MGSILNRSVGRRLEHYAALRVLATLIVVASSAGAALAHAESGSKLVAAERAVTGGPERWVTAQKPGSPDRSLAKFQLQSVACPDVRTCFVVGSQVPPNGPNGGLTVLASHDGGASWSTVYKQPGLVSGLLSCPRPRQCYAIGWSYGRPPQSPHVSLLRTTDGGKSWSPSNVGLGHTVAFFLAGFTCPAATVCYVTGMTFSPIQANGAPHGQPLLMATKDGGTSWTRMPLLGIKNLSLRAIACAGVTSCDVGGATHETSCFQAGAILHTNDGGRTWNRQFGDCAAAITVLACPTAGTCYAGGWYGAFNAAGNQLVLRTTDGGTSWEDQLEGPIDPAGHSSNPFSGFISAIACPDVQICFLSVGNQIVATTNGGKTWAVQTSVANAVLNAISCPAPRVCMSVGSVQPPVSSPGPPQLTGLIVRTVDGGKTWTKL